MSERGVMRCKEKQLVSFRDLRWGKITPTDLDGFLDFGNKAFVCIEYKFGNAEIPYGQKLALTRMVDAMRKPCILIHATHNCPPEKDIDGANAGVVEIYYKGKWHNSPSDTVKEAIGKFLEKLSASKFI